MTGLIVDLFAGGGGASTGLEAALGRPVDVAVNHDEVAIAVHRANHPGTHHLTTDVWDVDPREATGGRPVELLWASPDCRHFSVAKGDVPRSQGIRSLAWVVVRWAAAVRPRVILLENVREFQGWGPLAKDGRPDKARKGVTFIRWVQKLERLGYRVSWKVLDAARYGAPTHRKRLFVVARCDGRAITWPEPTHGPGLLPFRTAAECIDWSIPCPSIFERPRPLAEKTLWRIAQGIRRFVLENPRPFVLRTDMHGCYRPASLAFDPDQPLRTVTSNGGFAVCDPFVVKVNHGKREARGEAIDVPLSTVTATQRGHALVTPVIVEPGQRHGRGGKSGADPLSTVVAKDRHAVVAPLGTVVAGGQKHALVSAFLAKHFGGVVGIEADRPVSTITATDHHALAAVALAKFRGTHPSQPGSGSVEDPLPTISAAGIHVAEVRAFLTTYYGQDGTSGQRLDDPARTITSRHRLGLVTVEGSEYQIVDIGMRMLEPHELLRAQFGDYAERYDISAARTKTKKVRLIGNSVAPDVVKALVEANAPELQPQREVA